MVLPGLGWWLCKQQVAAQYDAQGYQRFIKTVTHLYKWKAIYDAPLNRPGLLIF